MVPFVTTIPFWLPYSYTELQPSPMPQFTPALPQSNQSNLAVLLIHDISLTVYRNTQPARFRYYYSVLATLTATQSCNPPQPQFTPALPAKQPIQFRLQLLRYGPSLIAN